MGRPNYFELVDNAHRLQCIKSPFLNPNLFRFLSSRYVVSFAHLFFFIIFNRITIFHCHLLFFEVSYGFSTLFVYRTEGYTVFAKAKIRKWGIFFSILFVFHNSFGFRFMLAFRLYWFRFLHSFSFFFSILLLYEFYGC